MPDWGTLKVTVAQGQGPSELKTTIGVRAGTVEPGAGDVIET